MNVHDSERIAGLLDEAGYAPVADAQPDVVMFNTCAVEGDLQDASRDILRTLVAWQQPSARARSCDLRAGRCAARAHRDRPGRGAPITGTAASVFLVSE